MNYDGLLLNKCSYLLVFMSWLRFSAKIQSKSAQGGQICQFPSFIDLSQPYIDFLGLRNFTNTSGLREMEDKVDAPPPPSPDSRLPK